MHSSISTHLAHALGGEEVLHEVLLHLLETALLAFLVELVGGHPELDGESAGSEGGGLVEALDCFLGALDVLVENEVLAVSGTGVKVFSLTQFN